MTALLDLTIRNQSGGDNTLDTVMRDMWQRFGQFEQGYSDEELKQAFESAATTSLDEFFASYIEGTQELDYNRYLEPFGFS